MMCEAVLARRNAGPWSVAPESVILGCHRVWGEATRDSAPFYERQLGCRVADSFLLSSADIAAFTRRMCAKRQVAAG